MYLIQVSIINSIKHRFDNSSLSHHAHQFGNRQTKELPKSMKKWEVFPVWLRILQGYKPFLSIEITRE